MADEPENLTLALLREMRAEMREGFEKAFGDIAAVRTEMRDGFAELQIAVAALSVDLKQTKKTVEQIHETQQNHGYRLNAVDGRLALIEKHTGMVQA
jgi:hypothetical protein